jgi:hypothetical protein
MLVARLDASDLAGKIYPSFVSETDSPSPASKFFLLSHYNSVRPPTTMIWNRSLFRQLLKLPPVRILIATGTIWLTVFTLFKFTLWREPHSAFFKSDHVYDLKYSALRQKEAIEFVRNANVSDAHRSPEADQVKSAFPPIICAAFVTIKRDNQQYLEESIGSMLHSLYPEERQALYLSLLFADTNPSVHPSWQQTWTHNLADRVSTYNLTKEEMEKVKGAEEQRNWYVKGLFDYQYVLKKCLQDTAAPYIAVFEDDIIFAEGWLSRTVLALMDIKSQSSTATPRAVRPWIYLRLFYTETSLRWREGDFWYRNMYIMFTVAVSLGFAILFSIRWLVPRTQQALSIGVIVVFCMITIPAFMAFTYMVGKYVILPLHGVVEMNGEGCCTQGMIYPRDQVGALLDYFDERKSGQTDSLIEEYSERTGLSRLALAPQVIQHVGRYSSRDNDATTTKSTWAFWFETYKAKKLKQDHEQSFHKIDWSL